jgi:hypothetical protein
MSNTTTNIQHSNTIKKIIIFTKMDKQLTWNVTCGAIEANAAIAERGTINVI